MEHRATSLNTARGDGMSVCININTQYIYIYINNIHVIYTSLCIAFVGIRGSQD